MKKKTNEEFIEELKNKFNGEFISQENYKGNKIKIKFLHTTCNRIFLATPDNLLHNGKCAKCSSEARSAFIIRFNKDTKSLTEDEVRNRIYNSTNGEYELIGEYINSTVPFEVLHKKCNTVFTTYLNNFLRPNGLHSNRCRCETNNMGLIRNYEQFIKEFNLQENSNEYNIVGEYTNYTTKIELLHKKCNKIWSVTPSDFLRGSRCFYCHRCRENNKSWNGGVSSLNSIIRKNIKEWYVKSASLYNNECLISNEHGSKNLTVHHIFKNFSNIRDEVLKDYKTISFNAILKDIMESNDNYSNILQEICNKILIKHYQYGYGVVISKELHKEFHAVYGRHNNTPEQFIEFAKSKGVILLIQEKDGIKYLVRSS